jgi:hydroxymethylglutaryl-CoA reductase
MNICHGLLNALQVSTPLIEDMVNIARTNGALGAKLTGGGGGGSVVALCPGRTSEVAQAFVSAGFEVVGASAADRM